MNEMFDDILEKGEQIIKVFKPNKERYWKMFHLFWKIPLLWPYVLLMSIPTLFILPVFILKISKKTYENTYYCYTNKRLIIRSGAYGISYSSLNFKDINSTNVIVGFLDSKTNTGMLTFKSPSLHYSAIVFDNIENPYAVMKEIKEYIDTVK